MAGEELAALIFDMAKLCFGRNEITTFFETKLLLTMPSKVQSANEGTWMFTSTLLRNDAFAGSAVMCPAVDMNVSTAV